MIRHYWNFDYLFIDPRLWVREPMAPLAPDAHELLEPCEASWVLDQVARTDRLFLRRLARAVFESDTGSSAPRGHEATQEDGPTLEVLKRALGTSAGRGQPPRFARLYVCRRQGPSCAAPFRPDPRKTMLEAIEAAQRAPRGYVIVEVFSEDDEPLSRVRLELLLADGELRTVHTNDRGRVVAEPVPRGQCHIRAVDFDSDDWRATEGAFPTVVDQARRRRHVVLRGENLARIARRYGLRDWKRLWNAADNRRLKDERKLPNLLRPGDEVVIPGVRVAEIVRPTDATHRIIVKGTKPKQFVKWST